MTALKDYQHRIAQALRKGEPSPRGIEESRFNVYRRLVYNNLRGFIDQCFPIARGLLGDEAWNALCRAFFEEGHCLSPLFKDIPETYLDWIEGQANRPEWLHDLMHYEWLELAAYQHSADIDDTYEDTSVDTLLQTWQAVHVRLNPTLQLGLYPRPVHNFAINHPIPDADGHWYGFVVFRARDHHVRFHSVNVTTLQLLQHLTEDDSLKHACHRLREQLPQTDMQSLVTHTVSLLEQLKSDGIVMGYQNRITATG